MCFYTSRFFFFFLTNYDFFACYRIGNAIYFACRRKLCRAIPAYEEADGAVHKLQPHTLITQLKNMKLHLPKGLRKALIACMTVVGCIAYTGTQAIAAPNDGVKDTVTITQNYNQGNLYIDNGHYGKEDEITFNLNGGWIQPGALTIDAAVVIQNLNINDGYSSSGNNTFTFTNTITGTGNFVGGFKNQHYTFEGDMSGYSGNMSLTHGDKNSSFTFANNTSGTGTITSNATVNVNGATMNNSAITTATLNITGTSSFAGDVTATTLTLSDSANMSIAAGKTLSTKGAITGSGQLTFGENAVLNVTGMMTGSGLVHETFGYRTDTTWAGDLLGTGVTATAPTKVIVDGFEGTMATDGTVSLTDTNYYIIGATTSSAILATNDDIASSSAVKIDNASSALTVDADITLPKLQATLGRISLTEDLTVTGASSITGTTVEGAGELIVANGATLQVNSTAQNLKSNIRINAGGTMQFLGTGEDAINYGQTDRTIYVDGIMDVGTTRQTVGNWDFELTGGTIQGAGQASQSNIIGLDFHAAGTITGKALEGATAAAPTKSTISTNIRYNGQLSLNVDENARLDITGKLIKYGAAGTLAITVNDGGELNIRRKDAAETTLDAVTLNGGSLFRQGTTGAYTTNITTLTVGADGGVVGTSRDSDYGHSHQSNIKIGTLTGTGDLTVVSNCNTSATSTVYINGGSGYSGTVKVQSWSTADADRRIDLDVASSTALANAVVELGGSANNSNYGTRYTTNLVLGASAVTVKGIKDAADRKSAGNVIIRSSSTPSTLTINTAGNDYSTKSGVTGYISLVKSGEGKQSFSGDMSSFNKAITVNAGVLEFLKASTTLNVTDLTVAGGNLTVNGTVNTNNTLSYTSGTIDANLNVKTGTALTLNGTVDMVGILTLGDSLTLAGSKLTDILGLTEGGKVELFSGVTSLTLGDQTYTAGSLTEDNRLAFGEVFSYAAPMSNPTTGELYLGFDANGVVFAGMSNIPEPTTATLSLLALAGLAARRRRK